eukprot:GHVR01017314.1.p1 GENE.GHVR01017314.1~~GHVR01017314.1.p1  ORF type:complete len:367 (+),score=13.31 GHVR01017314.1:124-1224(+)
MHLFFSSSQELEASEYMDLHKTDRWAPLNFFQWPADDFRTIRVLANAIHGKVFLMEFIPLCLFVAVKRISNFNISCSSQHLENAYREIEVSNYLTKLRTEFAIRKLGCFRDDQFTYYVTEFAEQGELLSQVVISKRLGEFKAKYYSHQLLRAVKSMHDDAGIAHRDISLENTVLHSDDTLRIVDFGQSVPLTSREHLNGFAGKSYYRAPEVYSSNYSGGPADVFSCGIVIFIMVIGSPPWQEATNDDGRFKFVSSYGLESLLLKWKKRDLVSDNLLNLLTQMTQIDPLKRATLQEALDHPWFNDPDLLKPRWPASENFPVPHWTVRDLKKTQLPLLITCTQSEILGKRQNENFLAETGFSNLLKSI